MMITFVLILDCFHSRKSSPCHCGLPQASDGGVGEGGEGGGDGEPPHEP